MSIRTISTGQLRRMGDQEGLILQGCGGDPQEWLDGINEILAQECILKKGAGFEEAYTFRHDGMTCMLFPFKEDMELDVGRLAAWRLASYSTFGGTWLSDYVPNRLGGFIREQKIAPERIKPDCPLIGEDGNIFRIMGIASEALRENGMQEQAEEMRSRIFQCHCLALCQPVGLRNKILPSVTDNGRRTSAADDHGGNQFRSGSQRNNLQTDHGSGSGRNRDPSGFHHDTGRN